MHRKPKYSVACIKCSINVSYFKSEIVPAFIRKITLTPNLKKFSAATVQLVEKVFIIGSYWRITMLDKTDMVNYTKTQSYYVARWLSHLRACVCNLHDCRQRCESPSLQSDFPELYEEKELN